MSSTGAGSETHAVAVRVVEDGEGLGFGYAERTQRRDAELFAALGPCRGDASADQDGAPAGNGQAEAGIIDNDEQAAAYGKFAEKPTRPELARFFFLDDEDRRLIAKRRGDHNRLGFALQTCTVRYVGLFLEDPLAVPWSVVDHLAEQLGIEDVSCVKRYTERQMTAYEHAWEIRDAYGYHAYEDPEWGRKFRMFLHGRAWTAHAEGPKALFDHAVGWLRRNRVLLPGVSVLPGRSRRSVLSRTSGCTPLWPGRPGGRTRRCLVIWWPR